MANIFKPGPATPEKKADKIIEPFKPFGIFYLSDNYIIIDNDFKEYNSRNFPSAFNELENVLTDTPADIGYAVRPDDPLSAWDKILKNAGASLSRDSIDKRIIREVESGKYKYGEKGIINTQEQVGGWPELRSEEPPEDTDHDGMPDYWEKNNNLNPGDYSDRNNYDLDKDYTNIEYYLIKLVNNSD